MGKKDIAEKNLEAWNDVFADIVNVLLFKGKRLMKEKDLEADTKDSMIKADGELHHGHDTEVVAHDVEYVVLVSHGIHRIEVLLDVSKACPAATLHHATPHLQSNL